MNANKRVIGILAAAAMGMASLAAEAVQGLDASSQTKVNNAMAKAWSQSSNNKRDPALEKRVVNIGSRRNGDCNVNVGTAQAGRNGRQPKEIVVTTKEVINVCK